MDYENEENFKILPSVMPFACIIPNCNEIITNSTMIKHLCSSVHRFEYQEIKPEEKITLMVSTDRNFLKYKSNVCLGVLGFKHKIDEQGDGSSTSAIMIMACRNNYLTLHDDIEESKIDQKSDFVTFWVAMPKNKKSNLRVYMTVHSGGYICSYSKCIDVRDITDNQNIEEFMIEEMNYIQIKAGLLKKLAINDELLIEIIVKEK